MKLSRERWTQNPWSQLDTLTVSTSCTAAAKAVAVTHMHVCQLHITHDILWMWEECEYYASAAHLYAKQYESRGFLHLHSSIFTTLSTSTWLLTYTSSSTFDAWNWSPWSSQRWHSNTLLLAIFVKFLVRWWLSTVRADYSLIKLN